MTRRACAAARARVRMRDMLVSEGRAGDPRRRASSARACVGRQRIGAYREAEPGGRVRVGGEVRVEGRGVGRGRRGRVWVGTGAGERGRWSRKRRR